MADRRISELSVIPAVAGDDALAIVDTSLSETNKVSVEDLLRSAPAGTAAAPSIAFVDSAGTGLYRSAANELSISTNGGQRVVVNSTGQVGIGTSSPSAGLEIATTVTAGVPTLYLNRLANQADTSDIALVGNSVIRSENSLKNVVNDSGIFTWNIGGTDSKAGISGSSEVMRINSAGSVGIGTSSPNALLHTSQTSGFNIFRQESGSVTTFLYADSAGKGWVGTNTNHDFAIGTNNVARMWITSAGDVGIGTSNPAGSLEVSKSDNADIYLRSTTVDDGFESVRLVNTGSLFAIQTRDSANAFVSNDYLVNRDASGATYHAWSTSASERMRIDSAGRVGIGVSSPTQLVHINEPAAASFATLRISNADGSGLNIAARPTSNASVLATGTGHDLLLGTEGTERMRIRSNGVINFANCPTYADDTAAGTGGLVAGDVYKTSTGELRIKL